MPGGQVRQRLPLCRADKSASDIGRDLGDLGRRLADAHAARLERLLLRLRGAGGAGDNRARVAHRLAGRRREAGDVGDDRLAHVVCDVVGGLLLGGPADLARHHDQLRLRVGLERGEHVYEARAGNRVAADPDDARVAEPALGELVADLVGQRAGARDDADVRLAGREDARAVRADEPDAVVALQVVVNAQLVVRGDPLGDRDDQRDAGFLGLEDRVGGEARRDEDHRRVRPGFLDRGVERVEDRDALYVQAALAGRHAGDDVGAVALVVERVERALAPRDAGDAESRVAVDEDAHRDASSTTFSAAPSIVASVWTLGRSASASSARPSLSLVPSSRTTNGTVGSIWANASMRPRATSSQRVMPPKMLNSTAVTASLERITSTALVISSAFAPPPASRKFAGAPPACATTSSVLITSPAPLPRMPTFPSSFTYVRPRSRAIRS